MQWQTCNVYSLHPHTSEVYVSKCEKCKKYTAQMLEVEGDLRRAPAKFENPVFFFQSQSGFLNEEKG